MTINSRYLLGQWEPRKILAIGAIRHVRLTLKSTCEEKGSFGI